MQVRKNPRTMERAEQHFTGVIWFSSQTAANRCLEGKFAVRCCCLITLEPRTPCSVWQSASSTQAEIQASTGPCGGPKLHWLPCVLDPSLELIIIPLALLACHKASPSPLRWDHEKSAVKKMFDTEWINWQAENYQSPLDKAGNGGLWGGRGP